MYGAALGANFVRKQRTVDRVVFEIKPVFLQENFHSEAVENLARVVARCDDKSAVAFGLSSNL